MQVSLAVPARKKTSEPERPPVDRLEEVVAEVAAGDRAAFRALYDATSSRVYGFALQILRDRAAAEEASLDVYAQLWRQAACYDRSKGSVAAWIASIARTRAIDVRRARAREQERAIALDELTFDHLRESGPDPFDASFARERELSVRGALDALPHEQRRAVEAAFFRGLSHTEIAAALGEPLGTVKTRIRSGLAALRRALAAHESECA
jgi:RNA polymerase sigma-70 factor (ECF subfamily)